jgi:hypothetical protein
LDHFLVLLSGGGSSVTHGSAFSLIITAVDVFGKTVYNYTGTITFSSSDPAAVLPSPYTFTSSDAGTHTFSGLVLNTTGIKTITVSGSGTGGVITLTVL